MKRGLCLLVLLGGLCLGQARAQMAVIDIGAIVQLVHQLRTLEQQLTQARSAYEAITGGRGMERLLAGTVRNYLPADWRELTGTLEAAQANYQLLSTEVRTLLEANAVLSNDRLSRLGTAERRELEAARQSAAMFQNLTRQALRSTSERFAAIQQLIDAIGRADDEKAILDLQARIGAEHGMLINENSKLQVLFQTLQAEEWARRQREREQGIAGIGSLRDLPAMGLRAE